MEFDKHIFTRGLPKTGQTTERRAGDDGTYETGWWLKLLNANNRTRFVDITADLVLDRATGLVWPKDWAGDGGNSGTAINWDESIDWALALDFADKTDWRLPNRNELGSLFDLSNVNPALPDSAFDNPVTDQYWTSSSYIGDILNAWYCDLIVGGIYHSTKTTDYNVVAVRSYQKPCFQ